MKRRNLHGYFVHHRSFRFIAGPQGTSWHRTLLILCVWMALVALACFLSETLLPLEGSNDVRPLLRDPMMIAILVSLLLMVLLSRPLVSRFEGLLQVLPSFIDERTAERDQPNGVAPQRQKPRGWGHAMHRRFLPTFKSDSSLENDIHTMRAYVSLETDAARRLHRVLIAAAIILTICFQVLMPLTSDENKTWALDPAATESFIAGILWSSFWMIFIVRSVAWYLLSICLVIFPRLGKYSSEGRVHVRPVAPDGKGGLASIGDLALSLALMASLGLPFATVFALAEGVSPAVAIGFPAYILFLTAIFFLPLWSVHGAMQNAKSTELDKWSQRFQQAHDRIEQWAIDPAVDEERSCGERNLPLQELQCMESIERLYARAEAMPIWPFNLNTLWQFCTVVLIPLGLFVYELLDAVG